MSKNSSTISARILQYGDQFPDIFVFPQYQVSEDWSDQQRSSLITLPQRDGGYDFNDGYSLKEPKVFTKRFNIFDACLVEEFLVNGEFYGLPAHCKSRSSYLRFFKDYMYRVLRGDRHTGGYKRLYLQMEDGSVRWTMCKATAIPYNSFDFNQETLPVSIDFESPDGYLYEIDNPYTYYVENYSWMSLLLGRSTYAGDSNIRVSKDEPLCINEAPCNRPPLLSRSEDYGYSYIEGADGCAIDGCFRDLCTEGLGEYYSPFSDSEIDLFVEGSAGATSPYISFRGEWNNPQVENTKNGTVLSYNGTIGAGEYLEIDLNSSNTGDIQDFDINQNIAGFNVNDITITGFNLDLSPGVNLLNVTGASASTSRFTINKINKYHN